MAGTAAVGVPGPCHSYEMQSPGTAHNAGPGAPWGCGCGYYGMKRTPLPTAWAGAHRLELVCTETTIYEYHGCGPTVAMDSAGIWILLL